MKKGWGIVIGLCVAGAAWANIGGFCSAVDVSGTKAYVGAGQVLLAIDVSDPETPKCSGTLYLPGAIEGVLVNGGTLFAACGEAGVHKVDLSNFALLSTYDSPGHAYGLALDASALYLADGVSGLQKLNPDSLELVGSFVTNGPAMDVVVEDSGVYLLDHFNGVIALDGSLNKTAAYDLIAFGNRMVSDGATLFVTDGEGKLTRLAIPAMTGTTDYVGIPTVDVAVSDSAVFMARGDAGVQVLGGAAIATTGRASGLAVDNGKLYVADGFGGLSIFDASSRALLGMFSGVARSRATAIANGLAYVAAGNQGVRIYDLADPTHPSYLSSVASSNALDVAIADGLLLVADAFEGLKIYDSTNLVHLGAYAPTSPAVVSCVGAFGSLVCVGEGYTVQRLDLTTPASPVRSASYASTNYVYDLDISGTNVLLATGAGGLEILSADLIPVSSAALPDAALSVTADGTDALAGWSMLDLSDPLTPIAVTNFAPLVRAMQLTLAGNTVYASADDGGTIIQPLPSERLFAVAGIEPGGGGVVVSWHSEAGRAYTIHKSTNLVDGFYVLESDVAATEPINTHADLENLDCAMYMITIDP